MWRKRVQVATHGGFRGLRVPEMKREGSAAGFFGYAVHRHGPPAQQGAKRIVDAGRGDPLHAALQQHDPAGETLPRFALSRGPPPQRGHLQRQAPRQQPAKQAPKADPATKPAGLRHHGFQPAPLPAVHQPALGFRFHVGTADLKQLAVRDAAGAGGFAGPAGEATIQMLHHNRSDLGRFQHVFDEVDAPTGTIQLVTQQLIGGTGGIAETAVHAAAQNALCPGARWRGRKACWQLSLHDAG